MLTFLISALLSVVHKVALGLGLGATTLALASFVNGEDTIESPRQHFANRISFVLRIALALAIAVQIIFLSTVPPADLGRIFVEPVFVVGWVMIAVIIGSAFLSSLRAPAWLSPVLMGGSWYALFLLQAWPAVIPLRTVEILAVYVGFLLVFGGLLMALRSRLAPKMVVEPTP